jgi:hypothetical protein
MKSMDEMIQSRYHAIQDLAELIVEQLREEVMRLGFPSSEVHIKQPSEARFRLEKDPSNSEYALVGDWFDERGAKLGCLLFHSDGSFFVEHDVVKPHPTKRQWFVEAVNAWGKGKLIKAEVRLLPQPE